MFESLKQLPKEHQVRFRRRKKKKKRLNYENFAGTVPIRVIYSRLVLNSSLEYWKNRKVLLIYLHIEGLI